jgi:hypothetical protein
MFEDFKDKVLEHCQNEQKPVSAWLPIESCTDYKSEESLYGGNPLFHGRTH